MSRRCGSPRMAGRSLEIGRPLEVSQWLEREWVKPGSKVDEETCARDVGLILERFMTCFETVADTVETAAFGRAKDQLASQYVAEVAELTMREAMRESGAAKIVALEGDPSPSMVGEDVPSGMIIIVDPLTSSASVDVGIPSGSVFGIFRTNLSCIASDMATKLNEAEIACIYATLQPGSNLLVSGYCLYGASTTLVLTIGTGTFGFTYDRSRQRFILTNPKIAIPHRGSTYAFNESRAPFWSMTLTELLESLKKGKQGRIYTSRYTGSLVADVHRVMMTGGT